jgi:hypothetical protein
MPVVTISLSFGSCSSTVRGSGARSRMTTTASTSASRSTSSAPTT